MKLVINQLKFIFKIQARHLVLEIQLTTLPIALKVLQVQVVTVKVRRFQVLTVHVSELYL